MARSKKSRARRLSYVDHREEAKHGKAATNNNATNNNADDDKESDDGEDVSLQTVSHVLCLCRCGLSTASVRPRRRQPQRKL